MLYKEENSSKTPSCRLGSTPGLDGNKELPIEKQRMEVIGILLEGTCEPLRLPRKEPRSFLVAYRMLTPDSGYSFPRD